MINNILNLPREIQTFILSFASFDNLNELSKNQRVCKTWKKLYDSTPNLWKPHICRITKSYSLSKSLLNPPVFNRENLIEVVNQRNSQLNDLAKKIGKSLSKLKFEWSYFASNSTTYFSQLIQKGQLELCFELLSSNRVSFKAIDLLDSLTKKYQNWTFYPIEYYWIVAELIRSGQDLSAYYNRSSMEDLTVFLTRYPTFNLLPENFLSTKFDFSRIDERGTILHRLIISFKAIKNYEQNQEDHSLSLMSLSPIFKEHVGPNFLSSQAVFTFIEFILTKGLTDPYVKNKEGRDVFDSARHLAISEVSELLAIMHPFEEFLKTREPPQKKLKS